MGEGGTRKVQTLVNVLLMALTSAIMVGCADEEKKTKTSIVQLKFSDANLQTCVTDAVKADTAARTGTDLATLDCTFKKIATLRDIEQMTALVEIKLDRNLLIDISPLAGVTKLTTISARENSISVTPDFSATEVMSLDLAFNKISNVAALAEIPELETLDLESNLVIDVTPFMNHPTLQSLNLKQNASIRCTVLNSLISNLGTNAQGKSVVQPEEPEAKVDCQ